MSKSHTNSIDYFFKRIEDHQHHSKLHKLIDVIIIAICAVVAGTREKIAKTIIGNGGDDILAVKENHKTLYDDIADFFKEMETLKTKEKRYYISSLECDAKKFGDAVRSHWGIENSVHWVLDMAFREDESRVRKGSAPENFASIRHIALALWGGASLPF